MAIEEAQPLLKNYMDAAAAHNPLYKTLPAFLPEFDATLIEEKSAAEKIIGLGVEGLPDLFDLLVTGKVQGEGIRTDPYLFGRFYTAIALQDATLADTQKIQTVYTIGLQNLSHPLFSHPQRDRSSSQRICETMMTCNGIIRNSVGYFDNAETFMETVASRAINIAQTVAPDRNVHILANLGLLQLIASTGTQQAIDFIGTLTLGHDGRKKFQSSSDEELYADLMGHVREAYYRKRSSNLPISALDIPQWTSMEEILAYRNAPPDKKPLFATIWKYLARSHQPNHTRRALTL